MTLDEAKILLIENSISFEQLEFENESEYYRHLTEYESHRYAKPRKVIALIIRSNNAKRHIELQFISADSTFQFNELYFGDFGYEMFDYIESVLADELLRSVKEIMNGHRAVISMYDMKRKRWLFSRQYWLTDEDDPDSDAAAFERAMRKIRKPESFICRVFNKKTLYEIYDWNIYRRIVKQ